MSIRHLDPEGAGRGQIQQAEIDCHKDHDEVGRRPWIFLLRGSTWLGSSGFRVLGLFSGFRDW